VDNKIDRLAVAPLFFGCPGHARGTDRRHHPALSGRAARRRGRRAARSGVTGTLRASVQITDVGSRPTVGRVGHIDRSNQGGVRNLLRSRHTVARFRPTKPLLIDRRGDKGDRHFAALWERQRYLSRCRQVVGRPRRCRKRRAFITLSLSHFGPSFRRKRPEGFGMIAPQCAKGIVGLVVVSAGVSTANRSSTVRSP
jgi:hypothetical protein